jgi:hypothetical protein
MGERDFVFGQIHVCGFDLTGRGWPCAAIHQKPNGQRGALTPGPGIQPLEQPPKILHGWQHSGLMDHREALEAHGRVCDGVPALDGAREDHPKRFDAAVKAACPKSIFQLHCQVHAISLSNRMGVHGVEFRPFLADGLESLFPKFYGRRLGIWVRAKIHHPGIRVGLESAAIVIGPCGRQPGHSFPLALQ